MSEPSAQGKDRGKASSMDSLFITEAPPLDQVWVAYEDNHGLRDPKPKLPPLQRQPIYAAESRELTKKMTAEGARDHHLIKNVSIRNLFIPSSNDQYPIPVRQYDRNTQLGAAEEIKHLLLYIHGGGLLVGESDSEELSCLRILKESKIPGLRIYSPGYRLLPTYPASTCLSDCVDVFEHLVRVSQEVLGEARVFIMGSSSGGELAALVSQLAPASTVGGVVLRCPVTVDSSSGEPNAKEYIPKAFRDLHHSATHDSFYNSLGNGLHHEMPRDGLPQMPLEASSDDIRSSCLPRTFIQVCTNDFLYSDGVCYAKLLEDSGVEVKVGVFKGWPHTFWLKAPHLPEALEADLVMLEGLAWVAGLDE